MWGLHLNFLRLKITSLLTRSPEGNEARGGGVVGGVHVAKGEASAGGRRAPRRPPQHYRVPLRAHLGGRLLIIEPRALGTRSAPLNVTHLTWEIKVWSGSRRGAAALMSPERGGVLTERNKDPLMNEQQLHSPFLPLTTSAIRRQTGHRIGSAAGFVERCATFPLKAEASPTAALVPAPLHK